MDVNMKPSTTGPCCESLLTQQRLGMTPGHIPATNLQLFVGEVFPQFFGNTLEVFERDFASFIVVEEFESLKNLLFGIFFSLQEVSASVRQKEEWLCCKQQDRVRQTSVRETSDRCCSLPGSSTVKYLGLLHVF